MRDIDVYKRQGLTLTQKDSAYLMAAKLSGSSTGKLLFKHILPNIAGPILVTSVLDIGTMMMELAGLSFLGLGVKPPMAEWGLSLIHISGTRLYGNLGTGGSGFHAKRCKKYPLQHRSL